MSQTAKPSRVSDSSKTKQANEAAAQEAEAQARAKKERLLKEASCVPVLTAQIPSSQRLIMKLRDKEMNIEMHGYYTVI